MKLGAVVVAALVLAGVAAPPAHAAAFLVDSLGTERDHIHNNGACATAPADGAKCTLTAALAEANASGFDDTILFDQELEGDVVIPANQDVAGDAGGGGLQIIGNLDADGHPLIGLDFSAKVVAPNLGATLIHFPGAHSALADIAVFGGTYGGPGSFTRVSLQGSDSVMVGTWLGLRRDGTRATNGQVVGVAAYGTGAVIGDSGSNEGNVIADGGGAIAVAADEVTIAGNRIGTNPDGTKVLPVAFGIRAANVDADELVIGGPTAADGNLIAGATSNAVFIQEASDVVIQSNVIGLSPAGAPTDGTTSYGNFRGIVILDAERVTIGSASGATTGRNVVSNQTEHGIAIYSVDDGRIAGNYVGTTLTGAPGTPGPVGNPTGNGGEGIWVGYQILPVELPGSKRAVITGNVSRGNGTGIRVSPTTADTTVTDNVVTGSQRNGIEVASTASGATIGTAALPNRVGGSGSYGITVEPDVTGTTIRGNRVGLAPMSVGGADESSPNSSGIRTQSAATISGNEVVRSSGEGIVVDGAGAAATTVTGNSVGSDTAGLTDLGNGFAGVAVRSAADVVVGGAGADANLISGNGGAGVLATDAARLSVTGNTIGATKPGTAALGNDEAGVNVSGSDDLLVNGNRVAASDDGIRVATSKRAKLTGNTIGGTAEFANRDAGVVVTDAEDVSVGSAAAGNVIGGSGKEGITATDADRLQVRGNTVGLSADRSTARPNEGAGVALDGSDDAEISGNVIGAGDNGVEIHASPRTKITGNTIGTNAAGATGLGNDGIGVLVDRSDDARVGGTAAGDGNVIAASGSHGLVVGATRTSATFAGPPASSGTTVRANEIGSAPVAAGGRVSRPNAGDGVRLLDAKGVIVGYTTQLSLPVAGGCTDACNRIEGNGGNGVSIIGDKDAVGNAVRGNRLGDNGVYPIDLRPASGAADGMTAQDFGRLAILPDADKGADTLLNAPYGITGATDHLYGEVVAGLVSAPKPRDLRVDLYAMDTPIDDDVGGGGKNLRYIRTVRPDENGEFIAKQLTAAEKANFYTAVAIDAAGNVSEAGEVCPADSDGDGLCDPDEVQGFVDVDRDGSSDQKLGTAGDPVAVGVRDVMLEVDWMPGDRPALSVFHMIDKTFKEAPHQPSETGLAWNLHADGAAGADDEAVAVVPGGVWAFETPGQTDLLDYRYGAEESSTGDNTACNGSFGRAADRASTACGARLAARATVFRYVLFANHNRESDPVPGDPNPRPPGQFVGGAAPTRRLVLMTPEVNRAGVSATVRGGSACALVATNNCPATFVANALLHELGHTFGLRHGGGDQENYKPNYLSVMNYYMDTAYMPFLGLDFSRSKQIDLDKGAVNETVGIGGVPAATQAHLGKYTVFTENDTSTGGTGNCQLHVVDATAGIDFNNDNDALDNPTAAGGIDAALASPAAPCATDGRTLKGFDDWAVARPLMGAPSVAEQDIVDPRLMDSDVDRDGVTASDDNCGHIANPDQADADGDGLGDVCLPEVVERDVSLEIARLTPDPVPDEPFRLRYTLRNATPKPATGVVVDVDIPAGTQIAGPPSGFAGGTWTAPAVPADGSVTLELELTVDGAGAWRTAAEVVEADHEDYDSTAGNAAESPAGAGEDDEASLSVAVGTPDTPPDPTPTPTPTPDPDPTPGPAQPGGTTPQPAPPAPGGGGAAGALTPAARAAAANALLLDCSGRRLAITGVKSRGSKVTVSGVATPALAGAPVRLLVGAKRAGGGKIGPAGTFAVTFKAPRRRSVTAVSGRDRSTAVPLAQRVVAEKLTRSGGALTVRGRLAAPAARGTKVELLVRERCATKPVVAAVVRAGKGGRFTATGPVPAGALLVQVRARRVSSPPQPLAAAG